MRIGISGAKGSFSEEAARTYANNIGMTDYSLDYLVSVENVLRSLERGDIDLGVFPTENSIGGPVIETLEASRTHTFKTKDSFEIIVRQNLMVHPSATPQQIRTIASHDQALKQCKTYLAQKWPHAALQEYADTAKAAADLAAGILPLTTAVIAARAAADVYGLRILDESIQDLKENNTMFVAVTRA